MSAFERALAECFCEDWRIAFMVLCSWAQEFRRVVTDGENQNGIRCMLLSACWRLRSIEEDWRLFFPDGFEASIHQTLEPAQVSLRNAAIEFIRTMPMGNEQQTSQAAWQVCHAAAQL